MAIVINVIIVRSLCFQILKVLWIDFKCGFGVELMKYSS